MKSLLKNITVGFLISIMVISTMGFSVNTLYCYCMGQYETSLFAIEHHCNKPHIAEVEDDFLKNMPPCCKKAMACHKPETDKDDCTKREKKFFKANLKFLELKKTELPQPIVFIVEKRIVHNYPFTLSEIHNSKAPIPTRPPPQYFGRFLLNFIQVYRC